MSSGNISNDRVDLFCIPYDGKNKKPPILIALGSIFLIGSLVAAGCLFSSLGYSSLAISAGGVGVFAICLSVDKFCVRSSRKVVSNPIRPPPESSLSNMPNNLSQNPTEADTPIYPSNVDAIPIEKVKFNRFPCKHEGNSCYVNTTLQIWAHIDDFRNLFDKQLHPLKQKVHETESAFQKRVHFQEIGGNLLAGILNGKRMGNLQQFLDALNAASSSMNIEHIEHTLSGGDPFTLMTDIQKMLVDSNILHDPQAFFCISATNNSTLLKQHLERRKKFKDHVNFPRVICCNNSELKSTKVTYVSEFTIDGIGAYRLEAITKRWSDDPKKFGHIVPIIRSARDKFVIIDDLTGNSQEIDETEIGQLVTSRSKWRYAYYVKVKD